VVGKLYAFLQSRSRAILRGLFEFLEVGKDIRICGRIIRRQAWESFGLRRQNRDEHARPSNAEQTLEKYSSIHASLL
jgi:hypothetical protein